LEINRDLIFAVLVQFTLKMSRMRLKSIYCCRSQESGIGWWVWATFQAQVHSNHCIRTCLWHQTTCPVTGDDI